MIKRQEKTDDEVLSMLDYLAWKLRVSAFEDDFKSLVKQWYSENTDVDDHYGIYMATILWDNYHHKGMVETYQENIQDEEACRALVYAVNN